MSVKYQSAKEKLAQVLVNRFAMVWRDWETSTPGKRLEDLKKILAARNVAARLQALITKSDVLTQPTVDDPLKAVVD